MKYDFSASASREDTNAEKYTLRKKLFATEDVIPAWVADMDIDTPDFVLNAVKKRLEHPVLGYEEVPESAFEAQKEWMNTLHGTKIEVEDIFYSHSVVASMHTAIEAFTKEGEGVIVQTPVYPPFFHSVKNLGRRVVKNSLRLDDDGYYTFDIEDFKAKIDKNTKLLLLCSPHNPVGRVWKREELQEILDICYENNIIVFADEIHSDLVYAPNVHIPFMSLDERAEKITLTAIGVGKTFNMAGFAMSSVVIQDENLKKQFLKAYDKVHYAQGASLSHVAFEAAYRNGKEWLEALKVHLYHNYQMLENLVSKYPEFVRLTPIEATYLAWIDCRGLGLKNSALKDFFVKEARLGLNAGISFGMQGSGFMRLNFAVSSAKMLEIIKRFESALQRKRVGKNKLG
ncbi:PatB family C-S lyase [Sulfurimonas sp.]|uniref:PatB family C-S lyase n=1 Tax=Sulfurimonas sp. TaxID=2022749 RepID=UPI0026054153|nr:PatB family C-S lyase [Sulfurimonas sp.]